MMLRVSVEEESEEMKKFVVSCSVISFHTLEEKKVERWKMKQEVWSDAGDFVH